MPMVKLTPSYLLNKYNVQGPRYTSYPTVPYWNIDKIGDQKWIESVIRSYRESNQQEGISLYIHLPFCESLCTFCACHKRITKNHQVEEPYISTLLKEWDIYCGLFEEKPIIKEIHLGGGTPTFFQPKNLDLLINGILSHADLSPDYEFSFEGHPNNTSFDHLLNLYQLGFRRVSYGVQDYNLKVQKTINRLQPFENVKNVTEWARDIGYQSISHDLVFGLPFQNSETIHDTMRMTKSLRPDRIAFYSYAHVPWIKNSGQRGYSESDLPKAAEKRQIYNTGRQALYELEYEEIGMDHFALKTDSLYQAADRGTLHRNFMGYTAQKTQLMIGLGMSSISDSWYGFSQNLKSVETYTEVVNQGRLPLLRGHLLSQEDLIIRQHILNIMCHFKTSWTDEEAQFNQLSECLDRLSEMIKDDLVKVHDNGLVVLPKGRPFVRNICMAFDLHLIRNKPKTKIFSMTI